MGRAVEELLYPAMEDFQLDIVLGTGLRPLDPPRLAAILPRRRDHPHGPYHGATRDRFGIVARLRALWPKRALGHRAPHRGAVRGGAHRRGRKRDRPTLARTPRLAIRLLRRVRDFVEVRGEGVITEEAARAGLSVFGVDELGLDSLDRRILQTLCVHFAGHPVGLSTLAVSVGEEPETVEDVYEPFLLQEGLIMRTPRGRVATPGAYVHLGLEVPAQLLRALSPGDHYATESTSPQTGSIGTLLQDALFIAEAPGDTCTEDTGLGD